MHGGVGRRFSPTLEDLPEFPPGWNRLCVSASDFMLLGSMPDLTALRAWKLLQQVDELKERGILLTNLRGFLNLVAFAYWVCFELAPENMTASMRETYLASFSLGSPHLPVLRARLAFPSRHTYYMHLV